MVALSAAAMQPGLKAHYAMIQLDNVNVKTIMKVHTVLFAKQGTLDEMFTQGKRAKKDQAPVASVFCATTTQSNLSSLTYLQTNVRDATPNVTEAATERHFLIVMSACTMHTMIH
jgi:hypothetical protein